MLKYYFHQLLRSNGEVSVKDLEGGHGLPAAEDRPRQIHNRGEFEEFNIEHRHELDSGSNQP